MIDLIEQIAEALNDMDFNRVVARRSKMVISSLELTEEITTPLTDRRRVFMSPSGKSVVKVPVDEYGILANDSEWIRFSRHRDIPMARCRKRNIHDLPVIIMERVEPITLPFNHPDTPRWVNYVDCGQVGHSRRGELLAYDYEMNRL